MYMSDEDIENIIIWNMGFGISPHDTIKDLINDGVKVPEYLLEEYLEEYLELPTQTTNH
jgi:hypothetical protein